MLITSTLVLVLLITIGLSFAYFTANIEGEELGETITVTGDINISNVVPQDGVIATKEFTLTGDSTTNQDMLYQIHLVIVNNGFTDNAIQYKLTSFNDEDDNGEVAPSITELKGIPTGTDQEIFLGNATFESPTDFNVHSYTLEFYFPRGEVAENENQGKTLEAYVSVREGHRAPLLLEELLTQYEGNISEPEENLFENINTDTENRMLMVEDDYDLSYVIRGAKDYVNNNLIFAEHQWKIVRINGDGSIRIIYNGTCPNNECSINLSGTSTQIGKSCFNPTGKINTLIGYMYGNDSDSYETTHANENDSTVKIYLDNWYANNILETNYKKNISDTIFCGDRVCESGGCIRTTNSDYLGRSRLRTNKNPDLKCAQKNDRFTVNDTRVGNGDLSYPIGLITADELATVGFKFGTNNISNYLHNVLPYLTMSPSRVKSYSWVFIVSSSGELTDWRVDASSQFSGGVRAVINLIPETVVTGSGSSSDPFIVQ